MTIHQPYPCVVYTGEFDENGHPDMEHGTEEVQIRCACTHTLTFMYGHHLEPIVGPKGPTGEQS